eukprot:14799863-Ditylum_brightwellii.AAC.1
MFDIKAIKNVEISGFQIHCDLEGENASVHIFMKKGTWVTFDKTSSAWGEAIMVAPEVQCAGGGAVTRLPDLPSRVPVKSGETVAFYVTAESKDLIYSRGTKVGNVYSDDGNLQILEGSGKSEPNRW